MKNIHPTFYNVHYMSNHYQHILNQLSPLRDELLNHPIYQEIESLESLQSFMQQHVFAVWDFMSLLKALQRHVCCVDVPWIPNADSEAARFVNEIVLAEETDVDPQGKPASHFDLYRSSMIEAGANVSQIDEFITCLRRGEHVATALKTAKVSASVEHFVLSTFEIIESDNLVRIASAFTFGREDLLPDVFEQLVQKLNTHTSGQLSEFIYYLDRHIELDGDEHGPLAQKLMQSICGGDDELWMTAEAAAIQALHARKVMWDGMLSAPATSQLTTPVS